MIHRRLAAILVATVYLTISLSCREGGSDLGQPGLWHGATILISLDGFRWDYRDHFPMLTLDSLAKRGVVANLRPPFPSKTFPSHHTIATGLWPNHHGVVGNTMYDPNLHRRFSIRDSVSVSDGRWWGGEPIWVTVEEEGQTAATYFWPGTEASIDGIRPTFWKAYSDAVPNALRVDQILEWLDLPVDQRPSLLTLYFSDVDGAGHRYGPLSDEAKAAAERVDHQLARLVEGLRSRNIADRINLIIVSDHGMSQLSRDRVVFIDDYVDVDRAGVLSLGEYVALWPDESVVDNVFNTLDGASDALTVYRKGEIPERFHLDGHARTPPIVGVVEEGWSVTTHEWFDRRENAFTGGGHGYDNKVPNMAGIFVASGPVFKSGVSVTMLESVDVYNLLAASLNVEPAANDGNSAVVEQILNRKVTQP